ncbi:dnaJ protein [Tripterygium wilfordii]|uniref:DnaJ protein n=1 Tax=Tripterygium wilfordii TaxID=458696 RepID=A0A7J7D853_TRIWF|nr:dnaJ protein [Tripterygium wilfordii]
MEHEVLSMVLNMHVQPAVLILHFGHRLQVFKPANPSLLPTTATVLQTTQLTSNLHRPFTPFKYPDLKACLPSFDPSPSGVALSISISISISISVVLCNRIKIGGGSSRGRRQRRGEDVIHPLKVSLEDLYNGTSKKLSLSRNVICSKCKGKGSKSGASMKCSGCQGSGMKVSIRHLGPSMIQQMQHPCNECKGTGEMINDKDRCPQCKGEKVIQEKKVLEVVVEKGMQNGQRITFPGEADEAPDTLTGDIVFVLQQKEHPKFKRKGDDLFVEHTLSLTEALCGFHFIITHLDGRQLIIKSQPGEVVKPDQFKAVNDEGMPMYQRPFMKGKLYIHFSVDFPDTLAPEQCKALETVLPPRTSTSLTDMELEECEETTLHDVNIEEEMRRKEQQRAQEAYDEDEDMHGGAQKVQCAQQ